MSLEARLSARHGGFHLQAEFSAPARGVTAVFGPSGCGKTSLLRAVAGLDRAARGSLRLGDEVWQDEHVLLPAHRRALGYVFQEPSLFPHLRVRGNLEYGLRRLHSGERRLQFDQVVALLGLEELLLRRPHNLSGGERQRVAMGRAMLTSPRLLLMDEPLAALDLQSKADILPFLERLHEELAIPVLYVSHVPDEVSRLADHLLLMERGRVRAAGPVAEMLTRLDLPMAMGGDAEAVVEATVASLDERYRLARLTFAGGEFSVPAMQLVPGRAVRLRILARDVSLTLQRQTGTSILNIIAARVESIADQNSAQVTLRLSAGGVPILSRLTRKSVEALNLGPGSEVYAQVKSVAVLA